MANDTLVGTKLTEPIGSSNSANNTPPWAEAGSVAITRPNPRVKVLQWLRAALLNVRSHTLEQDKAGFTCSNCPNPRAAYRTNAWTGEETSLRSALLWRWISWETHFAVRCKTCNTKYSRWKRAKKAMRKITDRGMDIWFITLTRPNITGVPALDHVQEIDRDMWIKDFKKFRRTKIWKENFAGGYWFYEFTSHVPGDKIFAKGHLTGKPMFIREVTDHEINGHLHILATSEGRIPMKELAAQWGDRVDFRRPKRQTDVMRYLRGYLVKCGTQGVNMRPFGDIHRRKNNE